MESKGSKGNPDLIGIKEREIILVEVVERTKHSGTFIDQVERYTKIGRLVVVLPVDTTDLMVWGRQELL